MTYRINRINELILKELNNLIQDEFGEEYGMTTVNFVNTGRDLKNARVYVSGLWKIDANKMIAKLQNKAHFFQNKLNEKMSSKNVPKLQFIYDISQEKVNKIEELLSQIEKEKK